MSESADAPTARHLAMLTGREPASDDCSLGSIGRPSDQRIGHVLLNYAGRLRAAGSERAVTDRVSPASEDGDARVP